MTAWQPLADDATLQEPPGAYVPLGAPAQPLKSKFHIERWGSIVFDGREEWAIKRILPRQGLAAIYGKPGSLKSFVASHIALCIALGWPWAGRRVTQGAVVYVAAEGAGGLRKRKAGFAIAHPDLPAEVPFAMIATAPNLGTEKGDLAALVSAIEGAGVSPVLIVLDTLAQTLGAGDENGTGMTAFVANAGALAAHFRALVLIVHHVGLGDDRRMRGHSSLNGALDAVILSERQEGETAATLTLQKLKDEASEVRLMARLSRVVLGYDEEGDEISTLVVDSIEDAEQAQPTQKPKSVPPSQRLLMAMVTEAIDDAGKTIRPFGASGPVVRAVADAAVRNRFYSRIAEQAEVGEDTGKIAERQRKGFNRAIAEAIKAQRVIAGEHNGERFIWLP